jgi:hypothetical protein
VTKALCAARLSAAPQESAVEGAAKLGWDLEGAFFSANASADEGTLHQRRFWAKVRRRVFSGPSKGP